MENIINNIDKLSLENNGIDPATAEALLQIADPADIFALMAQANRVRAAVFGRQVELCAIINARSGRCGEDCAFCAQSSHFETQAQVYPMLSPEKIIEAARAARDEGATRFSIVTSGRGVRAHQRELPLVARAIEGVAGLGLSPCASLGILDKDLGQALKDAGLVSYHHNLETSESHYPNICTTHAYARRLETARLAQEMGFRLCSGGILGLGETRADRLEMALTLKALAPASVPLNFLNPIAGTPLANQGALPPLEILKTIAVFRLLMPNISIRTCGGREANLRGLQPLMFAAGADSTMTGNYLTTQGRTPAEDRQDIADMGLSVKPSL